VLEGDVLDLQRGAEEARDDLRVVLHQVEQGGQQSIAVLVGEQLPHGVEQIGQGRVLGPEAAVGDAGGAIATAREDGIGGVIVLRVLAAPEEGIGAGQRIHHRLVLLLPRLGIAGGRLGGVEQRKEVPRRPREQGARAVDVHITIHGVERAAAAVGVAHGDAGDLERGAHREGRSARVEEAAEGIDIGVAVPVLVGEGGFEVRQREASQIASRDVERHVHVVGPEARILGEHDRLGHLDGGARAIGLEGIAIDRIRRQARHGGLGREQLLLDHLEELLELGLGHAARAEQRERGLREGAQPGIGERRANGPEGDVARPVALAAPDAGEGVAGGRGALRLVRAVLGEVAGLSICALALLGERANQAGERARLGGEERLTLLVVGVRLVERDELLGQVEERVVQADLRPVPLHRVVELDVRGEGRVETSDELAAVAGHRLELRLRVLARLLRAGALRLGEHALVDLVAVFARGVEVANRLVRAAAQVFREGARANAIAEHAVHVVAQRGFGRRSSRGVELVARGRGPDRRGAAEGPEGGGEARETTRRAAVHDQPLTDRAA
jgi:hypothetical protein